MAQSHYVNYSSLQKSDSRAQLIHRLLSRLDKRAVIFQVEHIIGIEHLGYFSHTLSNPGIRAARTLEAKSCSNIPVFIGDILEINKALIKQGKQILFRVAMQSIEQCLMRAPA